MKKTMEIELKTKYGQWVGARATYDPPLLGVRLEIYENSYIRAHMMIDTQQLQNVIDKLNTLKDWCDEISTSRDGTK